MTGLSINVVGGLRVTGADGRPVRITSRKAQALLGCLALEPGAPVSREFLATLLWEDSDAELARASLRQALTALRRALPATHADAICADAASIWLDATRVSSDTARLRAALRTGDGDSCLLELPSDELLAGLEAKSFAFQQWLDQQRGSFRRERIEALERSAARSRAGGDVEGQRFALERLLGLDPVNERAHRELMDVLARQGRWTEALRQYRACRDVLRRELDVATEPATDTLYREILRRRRAAEPCACDSPEETDAAADAPAAAAGPIMLRDAVVLHVRRIAPRDDHRDLERVRERDAAFAQVVRSELARFGGHVDGAVAGEAQAVFGLDAATGNEAGRAVRAAFALLDAVAAGRIECELACGVDAGQVLPQSVAVPFPLSGFAPGVARRLAQVAGTHRVAVSPAVLERLRERYGVTTIDVPGGDLGHVLEADTLATALQAQPFVGRRGELGLLASMLERASASGRGRVVVVRGEAGIGKTSLLERLLQEALDRRVGAHLLRIYDFGQSALERPAPLLAARLVGVPPGSSEADRIAAVERAVADGRISVDDRPFVFDLIGAAHAERSLLDSLDSALREQGRARALQRLLQGAAALTPQLIVVEDAHWADGNELAQLADLAAAVATCPVLLALSVRAETDPLGAAWRARLRGCPMTTLDLAPLDHDECIELAAAHGEWPVEALEHCIELAGGHPLYLEHLLRASTAGATALPGSVRALLLRRIDQLEPASQAALQAAAVLGHCFGVDALAHLMGVPRFDPAMLVDSGLAVPDGEEHRFAHALIRDALHESLLGSKRRELHRRAADWFAARDAGLCADHLAAAEDPGASAAYVHAAIVERGAGRFERALGYAERAVASARDARDHCASRATLGDVQLALGRAVDACATYRTCIDLAVEPEARSRSWLGLATALRILDRHEEALAALDRAARDLAPDDHGRQARLWTLRGNLHFPRGELDQCLEAHRRALEHARAGGSLEDEVRALGGLGDAQYQRGRLRSAYGEFMRCVELAEQHGLADLQLAYLPMVAAAQVYLGPLGDAVLTADRAVEAARRRRDKRAELLAHCIVASSELMRANPAQTLERAEHCVEIARALGARRFEAENTVLRGLALARLGETARGLEVLEQAVELARTVCPTYCGPWALAGLASVLPDDEPRARALLAEGERLLARDCVGHNYLEFHHYAMGVLGQWGDWAGVRAHADALERYMREEPTEWTELVTAAHRALADCATVPGPQSTAALQAAIVRARQLDFRTLVATLEAATAARASPHPAPS